MDKTGKVHSGHWQRTRDRILYIPKTELTEVDVLEGLLQLVFTRADTNEIARNLLYKFHNIVFVARASAKDLASVEGIGKVASEKLAVLFKSVEFIERASHDIAYHSPVNVTNAVEIVMKNFVLGPKEKLQAFHLDENNIGLARSIISEGELNEVGMDYDALVDNAQRCKAVKVIIAHNHPSGNVMPSKQDYLCTAKLYGLLRAVGSRLVDHIILSNDKYFSFYYTKILPLICEQYEQVLAKTLEHSRHESLSA